MSNDPDTRLRQRLFKKINKLLKREKIDAFNAVITLTISLAHAAYEEGLGVEELEDLKRLISDHYNARIINSAIRKEMTIQLKETDEPSP